jgi:hypothetical protein
MDGAFLVKKERGCAISGFGLSEKVPERNASHLYFMLVSLMRRTLPETIRNFVNSGGYERLGALALKVRRKTPQYRDKLCATAQSIYSKEWKKLTRENMIKTLLKSFSPASVSSFSISGLFESFQRIAPCFLHLLNHLVSLKRNKPAGTATESKTINEVPSDSESEDEYEDLEDEKDVGEDECETG